MAHEDKKSAADERAERLAKALRDNLRRRKDQARGRRDDDVSSGPSGDDTDRSKT